MIKSMKKPSSAEAMFLLAEAYAIEDYMAETGQGAELAGGNEDEFRTNRRMLEIRTLNSAVDMKDPGSWSSTNLLDALRFLNGRALEQVPNLHFLAEEKLKELAGNGGQGSNIDVNTVATDMANKQVREACEAWLKDCSVSCTIDDVIAERELETENEEG